MMSQRYTPEQKTEAIAQLRANRGSISLTHRQTGIPERTLREWRREHWAKQLPPPPSRRQQQDVSSSPDVGTQRAVSGLEFDDATESLIPHFESDLDEMTYVRDLLMREVLLLLNQEWDPLASYQRALIISQLLERVMKLDQHLMPYVPDTSDDVVIAYDKPSYERDDDEDLDEP